MINLARRSARADSGTVMVKLGVVAGVAALEVVAAAAALVNAEAQGWQVLTDQLASVGAIASPSWDLLEARLDAIAHGISAFSAALWTPAYRQAAALLVLALAEIIFLTLTFRGLLGRWQDRGARKRARARAEQRLTELLVAPASEIDAMALGPERPGK